MHWTFRHNEYDRHLCRYGRVSFLPRCFFLKGHFFPFIFILHIWSPSAPTRPPPWGPRQSLCVGRQQTPGGASDGANAAAWGAAAWLRYVPRLVDVDSLKDGGGVLEVLNEDVIADLARQQLRDYLTQPATTATTTVRVILYSLWQQQQRQSGLYYSDCNNNNRLDSYTDCNNNKSWLSYAAYNDNNNNNNSQDYLMPSAATTMTQSRLSYAVCNNNDSNNLDQLMQDATTTASLDCHLWDCNLS